MYEFTKRLIDILMSLLILILFSPLLIIIPILIKLETPGPVFADIPERVGKDGKLFRMYKFRSMIANAHELLTKDPKFRKMCEEYKKNSYKLKHDPRITKVGKVIRRFSLDEIPQVINILKGEMSLIGPRAYYPFELKDQQKVYPETRKYVREIMKARPGVTGTWQVGGRSDINFDKRVKMDAEYVQTKSILKDISIILKTPWAMISGSGAL
jgi:lipopolysaccharide/colanic/teichoic acid biosynthesis glycosyltransferase